MKTQWKLLKDLPGIPAGTMSNKDSSDSVACFGPPEYPCQDYCQDYYLVSYMRRHPEWFQEIKPRRILICEWDEERLPQPLEEIPNIERICEQYTPTRWWIEER